MTPTCTRFDVKAFILAGKAIFTLTSLKTGKRFTYKVSTPKDASGRAKYFVRLLTQSDNTGYYQYLGMITTSDRYVHGRSSNISAGAPSAIAAAWFFQRLLADLPLTGVAIHHAGRCGRCGRLLTVPESIESGIGPECANKMGQ